MQALGDPEGDHSRSIRKSKTQRRIELILSSIEPVREQLLAAMQGLDEKFTSTAFAAATRSPDPRERNKIATIERVYEELVNWVDELAERGLAEARRLNLISRQTGTPYYQLSQQGAITAALADSLEDAKDLRDLFQHGYPIQDLDGVHDVIAGFPRNLDRFLAGYVRWLNDMNE